MKMFLRIIDRISVWYYYWSKRSIVLAVIPLLFSGCVSLKTLEEEKIKSYEEGNLAMAERCLHDLEQAGTDEFDLHVIKADLRRICNMKEN